MCIAVFDVCDEEIITTLTDSLTVEISRYIVLENFKTLSFYLALYLLIYVSKWPITICKSDKIGLKNVILDCMEHLSFVTYFLSNSAIISRVI